MKENRYEDDAFFQKYAEMPRSAKGLSAAGEWPSLKAILPDFHGLDVLDVGARNRQGTATPQRRTSAA